jgi:sulfite exporter TauE/SafE
MSFPLIDQLVDLCLSPTSPWSGATAPTLLFLAGLAGGVAHCAPMCGAFVLGQVGDRLARIPAPKLCELRRMGAAALPGYHLGRITTYALLGALAAAVGGWLGQFPWLGQLRAALLLAGALAFLAAAIGALGFAKAPAARLPAPINRALLRLAGAASAWGGYPLGLALGLIPCGMIYAALAVAAAARDPLAGALGMAAFGLGTTPSLIAVGLAGHALGARLNHASRLATPYLLIVAAAFLGGLAAAEL